LHITGLPTNTVARLMPQNRVFGKQFQSSCSAPIKISAPALATQPLPIVRTQGRINLIIS
jgi:hypothetical protein